MIKEINHKNLIRLLKLTEKNNSPVVQDLRKEIIKVINETEIYISEIEANNFYWQMVIKKVDELRERDQKIIDRKFENARLIIEVLKKRNND